MFYDLDVKDSKQLLDDFFSKFKNLEQIFNLATNLNLPHSELYQEYRWGDHILEGFKTYKGYKSKSNYDLPFITKRPSLSSLINFVFCVKELYTRLPQEKQHRLIHHVGECIQSPSKLLGFQLELHTFSYFCIERQFKLIRFDLPGKEQKIPDLTIEKAGKRFDVECKTIGLLIGHPIILDEAINFINLLLKEKFFLEISIPNTIIQISIDKKLGFKTKDQSNYNAEELLQKCKNDSSIIKRIPISDTNIEENRSQSYTFVSSNSKRYIKLLSSVKNNYIEKLTQTIEKGLDKNFDNPIILILRPFGIESDDLINKEIRNLFNASFQEKQKEGLFIILPLLNKKLFYNNEKQVSIVERSTFSAYITSNFEKDYIHLFHDLKKL